MIKADCLHSLGHPRRRNYVNVYIYSPMGIIDGWSRLVSISSYTIVEQQERNQKYNKVQSEKGRKKERGKTQKKGKKGNGMLENPGVRFIKDNSPE